MSDGDMNWEAIGALGEVVGAGAVVVTLIYLAGQVRHATRAAQAAAVQTASALDQEFLLAIGQDAETARIWTTYMFGDPSTLSEDEQARGFFLMGSTIRRLENVHLQHRLGTISDEVWESRLGMYRSVAQSPAYSAFRAGPASGWMSGEFIDYMDGLASNE